MFSHMVDKTSLVQRPHLDCLKQKVAKKGISPDEFAAEANHIIVDILQYAAEHVLGRVLPATESSGLTPPSSSAHYTHTKPKLARYG